MLKIIPHGPALLIKTPAQRALIIPDLHLGFEKDLTRHGINIPSQTQRIYSRVRRLVKVHRPDRLIFLGDIKHGIQKILPHEWLDVPEFFEKLLIDIQDIQIIPGNHDGGLKALLPSRVTMHLSKGMTVKDGRKMIYLMHGHTWPAPEAFASNTIIMGHHHFTIELRDSSGLKMTEPVWLVAKCDEKKFVQSFLKSRGIKMVGDPITSFEEAFNLKTASPQIIVMPTFNRMLAGVALNSRNRPEYLGPMLKFSGIDVYNSELYLLDGTYLRLSELLTIQR